MNTHLVIYFILILLISTTNGNNETCLQSNNIYQLCVTGDNSQTVSSKTFIVAKLQTECNADFINKYLGKLCNDDDHHHHDHGHDHHDHKQDHHDHEHDHHDKKEATSSEKRIYGIISVLIVSIVSLVGLLMLPVLYKISFDYILNLLTAIAVGTLFGDAMFHLIPYIMGLHTHSHDHSSSSVSLYQQKIFKILISVFILYVFYLIEVILHWFAHYKNNYNSADLDTHEECHKNLENRHYIQVNTDVDIADQNVHQHLNTPSVYSNAKSFFNHNSTPCTPCVDSNEFHLVPNPFVENELKVKTIDENNEQISIIPKVYKLQFSNVSDRIDSHIEKLESSVESNGWMILLDNVIHNFANGLAIGTAFNHNIIFGITTVVAVICYRLRQELGDFTVLLQSGFSRSRALLWCLLSVIPLWIGFFVGMTASTSESTRQWIFVATIGMFLYISLVDLLPTLLADGELELKRFLIVNGGFLFGIGLMFLLAIVEEKSRD